MNTSIDITPVVEAVIALVAVVITTFVIPWIKSKSTGSKWSNLKEWASAGVNAAEAMFVGTKLGNDKRKFVEEYLKEVCKEQGYTFNDKSTRIALENAWRAMVQEAEKDNKEGTIETIKSK